MSKILWDDLKALYIELNTQRQKFQMNTINVPSNQNQQTRTSDISTLKDAIQSMSSHNQIGDNASTASVIVPDQYSQMRQTPITQKQTVINRISQLAMGGIFEASMEVILLASMEGFLVASMEVFLVASMEVILVASMVVILPM